MRTTNELLLSHSGVDKLCTATQSFIDSVTEALSAKIQTTLRESGIEDDTILDNVMITFQSKDVFNHVSSRYQRELYYEKNFHYSVGYYSLIIHVHIYTQKPEPIYLGSEWEWKMVNGENKLEEIHQYGYYIDVFKTINVSVTVNVI